MSIDCRMIPVNVDDPARLGICCHGGDSGWSECLTMTLAKDDRSLVRLGIVGHRYLANAETIKFVFEQSLAILRQAKSEHDEVIALSAIAEGADTLFAEAAIALDIPLEIIRPFNDYAADFETTAAKRRYEKLRSAARSETKLIYEERSNVAYEAAMNWIVEGSDLLVVAWDGLPAEGAGGTGDAVKRAKLLNRPWLHFDVTDLSVTLHSPE